MPPVDDPETPDASPPAAPETKSLFLSTSPVFGRHSGAVWSLTAAEAGEGGDALTPIAAGDPRLAVWGHAPLVRS